MNLKEHLEKLYKDPAFKAWREKHPTHYLAHAFVQLDDPQHVWQIGFYNEQKERMTTFLVGEEVQHVNEEAEVLKKPGAPILELDPEKVTISVAKALHLAHDVRQEKYPESDPLKRFFIIQHLDLGQVYNITFVTRQFTTLNIKLDAGTGKIIKHHLSSLGDLGSIA